MGHRYVKIKIFFTRKQSVIGTEGREKMSYRGEIITSSQNKFVAMARSLCERKQRQKSSLFRFDGIKLLCEAVTKGVEIEFLLVKESAYESVLNKAEELYSLDIEAQSFCINVITDTVFDKISEENAPEGVIAVARYDTARHREIGAEELSFGEGERILLLESVRDPQNVGAILRTAAAFSVDRVIMSRDCADIYSSKTLRASMGAVFALRLDRVDAIAPAIMKLQDSGRRVYAAALDDRAKRLGEMRTSYLDCVVIGNEGHGLTEVTLGTCDESVYIPMADGVESLNAAVAASVLMWEFFGSARDDGERGAET